MKKSTFQIVLFFYHLVFIILSYLYCAKNGSDAHLYWFQGSYTHNKSWLDFANYGTDFILFINYPFVKLGLPLFIGFLGYGIIGFFGILQWIKWTTLVFGNQFNWKGVNLVQLIFLLPNLHFWTATLGKEPIIFWAIATVFYALAARNYKSLGLVVGSWLLIVIRPHVALMLLLAIALVLMFQHKATLKKRLIIAVSSLTIVALCSYMILQLSEIKYLNWHRIRYYNDYSILSFKHSGTYVPMLEYNYGYRLFSFNFRPLFFDIKSLMGYVASAENLLLLVLCLLALFYSVKFYKKIHFSQGMNIAFIFTLIAGLLYVQRYANLGIFLRTKIMFEPFMVIALFCIIKQGFALNNSKSK